jgi:pimeloyl-ACP methyl ester carboxylesterase
VALLHANDVHLYYERIGSGPPLVCVHGSWGDHTNWDALVPLLSEEFDIVTYDRRGHSESERLEAQGSTDEDASDLAALVEALDLAPANIVANSFGGIITLRLAASRPELLAKICLHEPPGIPLLLEDPENANLVQATGDRIGSVVAKLVAGEHEAAASHFVNEVAFGPGVWETALADDQKAMFVRNAPTFLDECNDPNGLAIDLEAISSFDHPTLLTQGDQSPPFFAKVIEQLAGALPNAERRTLAGAGHVPQLTHPQLLADTVVGFVHDHS